MKFESYGGDEDYYIEKKIFLKIVTQSYDLTSEDMTCDSAQVI